MQGYKSELETLFAEELGIEASAVESTLTEQGDETVRIDLTVTGTADELDRMQDTGFLADLGVRITEANPDLAQALGFGGNQIKNIPHVGQGV